MLSIGFRALFRHEMLRFRRPKSTFMPLAITNVLYFAVFDVIRGNRIDEIANPPRSCLSSLERSSTPSRTPRSRSSTADRTSTSEKQNTQYIFKGNQA